MLALAEEWKTSGLSQKAFSALHGINIHTFCYWIARSKEKKTTSGGFLDLSGPIPPKPTTVEIIYPNGVRLCVENDLSLISQLIRLS